MGMFSKLLTPSKLLKDTSLSKLKPVTQRVSLTKGLLLSLSEIIKDLKLIHKQHQQPHKLKLLLKLFKLMQELVNSSTHSIFRQILLLQTILLAILLFNFPQALLHLLQIILPEKFLSVKPHHLLLTEIQSLQKMSELQEHSRDNLMLLKL